MLPKAAFSGFTARYREPNVEEGFEDITEAVFKVRDQSNLRVSLRSPMPCGQFADLPLQFDGSEDQKAAWWKFWIS